MFIKTNRLYSPEGDAGGSNGGGSTTLLGGAGGGSSGQQQQQQQTSTEGNTNGSTTSFDFRSALDESGKFKQGWDASLPEDLKEYASEFGKYPDFTELLRGHANKAKLIGQRQQIKPPGPDAKPEEIAAWRKTLGIPEKPEGYQIAKPEKLPEGVDWSDAELQTFQKFAHEQGLTPQQVNALVQYDMNQRGEMFKSGKAKLEGYVTEQRKALETEWGENYGENVERAKKAAGMLGLDVNDPEIGNSSKLIKALHEASKLFSEDKFVSPDSAGKGLTSEAQAKDIMHNKNNPLYNAFWGNEGPARMAEAHALYDRLAGAPKQ
jgi:hypothetical protein